MGPRFTSVCAAIFLLIAVSSARTGSAQCTACPGTPLPVGKCSTGTLAQTGTGCSFNNCQNPQISGPSFEKINQGGGLFTVRMTMTVTAPWNKFYASSQPNGTLDMTWFNVSPAPAPWTAGGSPSLCEELNSDVVPTYLEKTNLSCSGAPYDFGSYSLRSSVCGGPCPPPYYPSCGSIGWCGRWVDSNGLAFYVPKSMLGCPDDPPKDSCPLNNACSACMGPGGGTSAGGGPPGFNGAGTGEGALLRYRGRGAGSNATFPGTTAWNGILGRNWSHDYAERIVVDPDQRHVWLITRDAVFREFSSLNPSTGIYQTNSPSDEYRTLKWLGAGTGWQLTDLDGTVDTFDAAGLWLRRQDKNGNAKVATYTGGALTSVSQPDGRREDFTYHAGTGLLASITFYGVGGSPSRQWLYTWTGLDLTRIDRPDGTALEFIYDGTGLLTRIDTVATDLSRRIEAAWEYDGNGNVAKTWKGDPLFTGPNAVEKYTFSYTNPTLPTATDVTDPLGNVSTYTLGRDVRSTKPKIFSISGGCPSCGVGPSPTFEYNDGKHPLLPSAVIDGKGNRTEYVYNNKGRMTSKTEAVGTALARTTTWTYGNTAFPGFPTRIEKPSTSGGTNKRAVALTYNATGDPTNETITGREAGAAFTHATVRTFNAAGQPLTLDPPGYTTAPTDVVTFTYNVTGRNGLLPDTRTDPIIGATAFEYDTWNRQTAVIDPNSVRTETTYDDMNRVLTVTRKGAVAGDDLATAHVYDVVGDLLRTTLPQGNVIEYGYDSARRLVSIERKPNAVTPKERTLYTLDGTGHRTKEELQHWNGTAWVTDSVTMFQYSSRCHLDKILHPDGSVTEYAYDCNGNLEKVWDANHLSAGQTNPATQAYAYDALNRLTSLTQPWAGAGGGSAVTSYTYDVQDHLATVTDANGNVTTYTTSDRDLVTRQVSPVSGTTNYTYTTHGILASEADARPITVTRTVDPLDRVTFLNYPDNTLDTTFTYDAVAVPFSKGRLTSITRNGVSLNYTYDRFGRVTQDGALTHTYDKNGNRLTVGYPFSVTATYTYDFADRPATLAIQDGANPAQTLVGSASYKPFGPLSDLSLGNGTSEARAFDARYFPEGITVPGRLDWAYTMDSMGNVTAIGDNLNAANDRTYGYQDYHYFLATGNGPWGARGWTYDKIGNRLTEGADTYTYTLNGGSNNTPKLSSIALGGGGSRSYTYDAIGDVTGIGGTTLAYNNVRRLRQIGTDLTFLYDGRDFLRQSSKIPGGVERPTPPPRPTALRASSTTAATYGTRAPSRATTTSSTSRAVL